MKKLLYTLLAVSIIFAACKKEEDEVVTPVPVVGAIVGTWSPTSADVNYSATMGGMILMDTSYTTTPSDLEWEFEDITFDADGNVTTGGETNTYTYSGTELTITESDGESETVTCTVTSTDMVVIMNDTEEEDGVTMTSNITINHTRQ